MANPPRHSRAAYEDLGEVQLAPDVAARVEEAVQQAEADIDARHAQRTRKGMKAAKARGAVIGRPRKGPSVPEVMEAMQKYPSFQAAARALKSTKTTIRRRYLEGIALAEKQSKK